MASFISKVRAAETPFYRGVRRLAILGFSSSLPVPGFLNPVLRFLYELHFTVAYLGKWALNYFYRGPLFRGRCAQVGRRFQLTVMPFVYGDVEIYIGESVIFFGAVDIMAARIYEKPRFVMNDRSSLGHNVSISVAREIVLEEDVRVASDCRITDHDGHPKNADMRAAGLPPDPAEVRPVRICRQAWIGRGCHIMKGVTIGEGAIVGANSVVIHDIPPYCLAMGNPAEVYFRNVGKARPQRPAGEHGA